MTNPVLRSARRPVTPPTPDLIVFSHLRWDWVWQRPQQLISRLSSDRYTWFVEEPFADPSVEKPEMRWSLEGSIAVGRLHVPGPDRHIGFDAPEATELACHVAREAKGSEPVVWLYTPLALGAARAIDHSVLVFDVMDDLAAFKGASEHMRSCHRDALEEADVVFTGGRSLHAGVQASRPDDTYLFPSGVQTEHYLPAIARRRSGDRPVAGYVGVIDERLDLALIAALAERLPDWEIRIVGPVAKIDPSELPRRHNISYPGPATYQQLPDVMAGFNVALMPFALNEATRSISPTKTLEYFAAGLPVVSTRVPDVVTDYGNLVHLADDADAFAEACIAARQMTDPLHHIAQCQPVLDWHHWDRIAHRMSTIVRAVALASSDRLVRTA